MVWDMRSILFPIHAEVFKGMWSSLQEKKAE